MKRKLSSCRWPALVFFICVAIDGMAQFSNRYPKIATYRHHIYLEAFEFPFYSNGPVSPVASHDGKLIAFSAYGWIWVYDRVTKIATRITSGKENDFLPTWSADDKNIAFVRDTGNDTFIQIVDRSGGPIDRVDHANSSELDPYYSPDGKFLYYSSSQENTFDIWRFNLITSEKEKIVVDPLAIETRPVPYGNDGNLFFISKAGAVDRINHYDGLTKSITTVDEGRILSQLWMDTNELGDQLALNWSDALTWSLNTEGPKLGDPKLELFRDEQYVIYPSWNRGSSTILFSMADKDLIFDMYEVSENGGTPTHLSISSWNFNANISTTSFEVVSQGNRVAARVSAALENGHYIVPEGATARFDSQNGEVYFYTTGRFTINAPSTKIKLKVAHGLFSHTSTDWISTGGNDPVQLELPAGWEKPGWYSGDHHFHLNYGGPFKLIPDDLIPILQAEDLDFATPMAANLHFQLKDQEYLDWENQSFPKVRFGQEIRSHFHGHIGLYGGSQTFNPWFWGPLAYESHTFDDRLNDEPLAFGRKDNSIGVYVHPIGEKTPLADDTSMARIPPGLIADVVNGSLDALEVACLWSDELGSSSVYHQFLNIGIPVALSAGTDAFPGYPRCMAVGTTRIMVNTGPDPDWNSFLDGIRKGKSVVTNGPMIDFKIGGVGPGEVVQGAGKVGWEMEVFAPNKVDHIELIANGRVVWASKNPHQKGAQVYRGSISLPKGGWIAVRAYGEGSSWPQMDSYTFAHTSPVWVENVGSYDPQVRSEAAKTMRRALDIAWERIENAYKNHSVTTQENYFKKARARLDEMIIQN